MDMTEVEHLYQLYGYSVWRRCYRILGRPALAEDMLHEVFLRVIRYGGSFHGDWPLAWLFRIAERTCFDWLRREQKHACEQESERILNAMAADPINTDSPRLDGRVLLLLNRVKEKTRRIVLLTYFDDLTREEVAERVGCSRKTVSRHLAHFHRRAARLLHRPLQPQEV